jgi:hypothetical protein
MPIKVLSPLIPGDTGVIIAGQLLIPILVPEDVSITLTNMSSSPDYIAASSALVTKQDLTMYRQARLVVRKMGTAGSAGSKLVARYTTTNPGDTYVSGNWNDLGTSEISVAIDVTNQTVASSWINLAGGAKADVYLVVITSGGDNVADPVIGQVSIQVR